MADTDGITQYQSFSERTLKYGRNLMLAATGTIVFTSIPAVDLANSRPFNFKIQPGGEIWLWYMLLAVLLYYAIRFFGLAVPDYDRWHAEYIPQRFRLKNTIAIKARRVRDLVKRIVNLTGAIGQNQKHTDKTDRTREEIGQTREELEVERREYGEYLWRRSYFWLIDALLPTVLFFCALWFGTVKIAWLHIFG